MDFDYQIWRINDETFETLVVLICEQILGISAQKFSSRNDGGRDSRFEGTAQHVPSDAAPWSGRFIIQAKHTVNSNGSCSDPDFNSEVRKEIVKVKVLKVNGEIDNYLIFTNRSLTGNTHSIICKKIKDETLVENVDLFGKERINLWLNKYDGIAEALNLNKLAIPLQFYEKDIKDLIQFFAENVTEISDRVNEAEQDIKRIPVEEKNKRNKLSEEYFEHIKKNSLSFFAQIDKFLKDPINRNELDKYQATIMELNSKIISHRNEYGNFEEIFDYIYDYILKKDDGTLDSREHRMIYILLHYMYYNCDLGTA
ncbi:hypothetical protein A3C59_05315 [Candidatus Daviesbacteria bacterium RIFCSPHIGHO2_02_FULL_36_13]|uniref:ABC-three component systems C-terminal domain-containing protein n=1 Tax=Candidatus Daviesbacteria bacterium RIFCSPHIGHO2_02_FULL_36_13 TaxID=1797768 RepID=A0A1F5JSG7_9BACT|nr:MAG: hypothetical protein A3C59_05315 [Candidatus Daviesbacteria bacterium RIFCSPHIGHO2_02_FULL_36_13]